MFLWCIDTDLSLMSRSPYDDLSLCIILKALSRKWFILSLSPLLWNIHIRGKYQNCDSINDFMIIHFLLKCIKDAIWVSELSSRPDFFIDN